MTLPLDSAFVSAAEFHRAYVRRVQGDEQARPFHIRLGRGDGTGSGWTTRLLPDDPDTFQFVERSLKFLLWQRGGNEIHIAGDRAVFEALEKTYSQDGERAFDDELIGRKIFGTPLQFTFHEDAADLPDQQTKPSPLGRNLDGCRIGFDLGGSDRKTAAVIDGKVVFSEEVRWDPYFQSDPQYHIDGIRHSLAQAAAHLPRVDAIGGSSAGVYVNNVVRSASLFRGVGEADFEQHVRHLFVDLQKEWDVPFEIVNDGDVTALAGSMSLNANAVLGIAMGTSEAVGYVDPNGNITGWLNELAFAPIDLQAGGPVDEWSGDRGCGVNYLSQQGVARLAPMAGFELAADMPYPDQLIAVQDAMGKGDGRARDVFATIGYHLAHAVAHYASFYTIGTVLILGRVTSGDGGSLILREAERHLRDSFPDLASIQFQTLGERDKRHGQAVAAASLPPLA